MDSLIIIFLGLEIKKMYSSYIDVIRHIIEEHQLYCQVNQSKLDLFLKEQRNQIPFFGDGS